MAARSTRRRAPTERPSSRAIRLAKVRARAQTTIPGIALDALGLEEGDDFRWVVEGNAVRLEPVHPKQVRTQRKGPLVTVFEQARKQATRGGLVEGRGPRGRGWSREDAYE